MSDKKHIDRLFQEKFKDFEAQPNKKVWESIEQKLKETNTNQPVVFPLWKKIIGLAVILVTGLAVFSIISNTNDDNSLNNNLEISKERILKNEKTVVYTVKENNSVNSKSSQKNKDDLVVNDSEEKNKTISKINTNNSSTTKNASSVNANPSTKNSSFSNKQSNSKAIVFSNKRNQVVKNTNQLQKTISTTNSKYSGKQLVKQALVINNNNANNKTRVTLNNSKNVFIVKDLRLKTVPINIITDSIISGTIVIRSAKSIEAEIRKAKKLLRKKEIGNRWTLAPNIAPVYYNTLGKGSQFGSQFEDNEINGETNTSYGLKVGYAVSKKFTLRSGISKLNLSYDTNDVIVFENNGAFNTNKPMQNMTLNKSPNGLNVSILSANNFNLEQIRGSLSYNAALSQRINYLEIPLELEYKLTDNRFNINIIGGFSTFILEGNKVVSEFEDIKTELGKANNINNVSFSTNLGIGLNYKFSKSFIYNLEPTFKYQLNGFSNTSGNFNPYIIGVYTGFSYKF